MQTSPEEPRLLSPIRIYRTLLGVSFFSILFFIPLSKLSSYIPFLSGISNKGSNIKYAAFNLVCLLALILFRKFFLKLFKQYTEWFYIQTFRKEKILITCILFGLIVSYQYKIHWGFWHKGAGGWVYMNAPIKLVRPTFTDSVPDASLPTFIHQAIIQKNVPYVIGAGWLDNKAMFLHYKNGKVLPANYGVLGILRGVIIFAPNKLKDNELRSSFMKIFKTNLKARMQDRHFILPSSVAYEPPAPYLKIDYTTYPDVSLLDSISFWEIHVFISPAHEAHVRTAYLLNKFKVPA